MKDNKTMAVLYAAFKESVNDMNETDGLTTFSELEQVTQDCIVQSIVERECEDKIWE